jgi:hypothetical protein
VKLPISLALGCLTLGGASVRPSPPRLRITVRLLNRAPVPARTAAEAERVAASIFQKAGVGIDWVDCSVSGACRGEPGNLEFWLHLLDQRPATLSGDAVGFAMLTHQPHNAGGYAAVSWQAVRHLTDAEEFDPDLVLGAAMAHELGHLLLGSHTHSPDGVMAARLGPLQLKRAARGELRLDDDQAERIRREIRQRRE